MYVLYMMIAHENIIGFENIRLCRLDVAISVFEKIVADAASGSKVITRC